MPLQVTTAKGDNVDLKSVPRGSITYNQLQAFRGYNDKVALIDGLSGVSMTFAQLNTEIRAIYSFMRQNDLNVNDTVVICSQNLLQFPVALHATFLAGATAQVVPSEWTPADIIKEVKEAMPSFFVLSARTFNKCKQALDTLKNKPGLIFLPDGTSAPQMPTEDERRNYNIRGVYSEIIRMFETDADKLPLAPCLGDDTKDTALIIYTAGTTGKPKGVKFNQFALNAFASLKQSGLYSLVNNSNASLACLPWAGLFALRSQLLQPLSMGKPVVVLRAPYYDVEQFCDAVQKNAIQHLSLVPDLIDELLNSIAVVRFDMSCVTSILATSSHLTPRQLQGLSSLFKKLSSVSDCYYSVETGVVAVSALQRDKYPRPVGIVEPGFELKAVSLLNGNDVGPGDRGEICIRSPFIMQGYYPADTISEQGYDEFGWYHTGDYGFYDSNGNVFRLARLRELIRAKGDFVVPSELESLICQNEEIADCKIVAAVDPETAQEVPRAFISPKQGLALNADAVKALEKKIIDYVEAKLPNNPIYHLKGGVNIALRMPRTSRDFNSDQGSRVLRAP